MRVRHLLLASMMVLGLVAITAPANAAVIDFTIDVEVNTVAQGTATTSGGILDVSVAVGDTVRFIVGIGAATGLTSYQTTVAADDPTEIDYQPTGSAQANNLAGASLNFAALADANAQLNDGTPAAGLISSVFGTIVGTDFYFVDYVVQAGLDNSAAVDFSVFGIASTSTGGDSFSSGTAQVRLGAAVPEPASMLLLGSGLAGLAGFGRKKFRK